MAHSFGTPGGAPLGSVRASPASESRVQPGAARVRPAALALAVTAVAAFVCLLLMFAGVAPSGTVNDYLNAVVGWLALALALVVRRVERAGWPADAAVAAVAVGAVGMTWGTWLVVTGTTGYYLAGLVSTLGVAAIGAWLLLAQVGPPRGGLLRQGPTRFGVATGLVMLIGVLAVPGLLASVDDVRQAPWHSLASGLAWLGIYGLFPAWLFRLRSGLERIEPTERRP